MASSRSLANLDSTGYGSRMGRSQSAIALLARALVIEPKLVDHREGSRGGRRALSQWSVECVLALEVPFHFVLRTSYFGFYLPGFFFFIFFTGRLEVDFFFFGARSASGLAMPVISKR